MLMKLLKGLYILFFILLSMFTNNFHLYYYSCFQTVPKGISVLISFKLNYILYKIYKNMLILKFSVKNYWDLNILIL